MDESYRRTYEPARLAAFLAVLVLLVCGQVRLYHNAVAWERPPAACQLLGGHWGIWSGWRCG